MSKKELFVGDLKVQVEKKKIKNLYLRVTPPDGCVQVSAPSCYSDKAIIDFIKNKEEWIYEKQKLVLESIRHSPVQYQTGEKIFLWGMPYSLEVRESNRAYLKQEEDKLLLFVPQEASFELREKTVFQWKREELSEKIPALFDFWAKELGVSYHEWRIRRMKTRWGSCNVTKKRIWLNLDLANYPIECLEYVIVHELCHLIEPNHSPAFWCYVERCLPDWKARRDLLKK